MREWFEEVLIVLGYSWSTWFFILLGPIIALGLLMLADSTVAALPSGGFLAPLYDSQAYRLLHRVEFRALGIVFMSWGIALRCYRKDRKRLFSL